MVNSEYIFNPKDLAPLYCQAIGIDKVIDTFLSRKKTFKDDKYPPYNLISISNDEYIIELAIAGFNIEDLNINVVNDQLIIEGKIDVKKEGKFLHQGISTRQFIRTFNLADHIKVQDANMNNGMLIIHLKREIPEEMKPRKIEITSI